MTFKIGDRIFVRGYIDEIRKDTVIVRNDGGYFGTILSEVTGELPSAQPEIIRCRDCKHWDETWTNTNWPPDCHYCPMMDGIHKGDFYCADAERRTDE